MGFLTEFFTRPRRFEGHRSHAAMAAEAPVRPGLVHIGGRPADFPRIARATAWCVRSAAQTVR